MKFAYWLCILLVGCGGDGDVDGEKQVIEDSGGAPASEQDDIKKFDVVFVVDSSVSMQQEAIALSQEFPAFAASFVALSPLPDVQFGITSSAVDTASGPSTDLDTGEAGLFFSSAPTKLTADNAVDAFRQQLMCQATPWEPDLLPSDPSYECGDESMQITREYMDCLCGDDAWGNVSFSGQEEPLEASLLAVCRSASAPPAACFDDTAPFTSADEASNAGFIRADSTVIVVMVGDEGDGSRRLQQGEGSPLVYQQAFEAFDNRFVFVSLSPNYDPQTGEITCNSGGAQSWQAERMMSMATESGGLFFPLEIINNQGNCTSNYFSEFYTDFLGLFQ